MDNSLHQSIETALNMAADNEIKVAELWVGPENLAKIQAALGEDPEIRVEEPNSDSPDQSPRLYWRNLRVREMAGQGLRVGETTCEYGPGVT